MEKQFAQALLDIHAALMVWDGKLHAENPFDDVATLLAVVGHATSIANRQWLDATQAVKGDE